MALVSREEWTREQARRIPEQVEGLPDPVAGLVAGGLVLFAVLGRRAEEVLFSTLGGETEG